MKAAPPEAGGREKAAGKVRPEGTAVRAAETGPEGPRRLDGSASREKRRVRSAETVRAERTASHHGGNGAPAARRPDAERGKGTRM